jgi:RNA polymerase sigma-70 factor, ECF subfamily
VTRPVLLELVEEIRVEHDCELCRPEVIAALVRAGDRSALDRATRCYGRHLLAVGERVCGDRDSAADAVQDALLAAGQHLDDYRGAGTVEGWLVRMVANACRSRRRGRKHQASWNAPLDEERAASAEPAPDECAATGELADALAAALLELPPSERAVVLMTQLDGWSGPEVAAALAISPEAVRARLARARRRLREQLGALWSDWSDLEPA